MAITTDSIVRVSMRERSRLLAYLRVLLRDEHEAEDTLQDIVLIAIKKADQIESESHLMGWLRTAGRMQALQINRNRSRHASVLPDDILESLESVWEQDEKAGRADEMQDALRACVEKLPPKARELIRRRYIDGLTGQRLAEQIGMKLGSTYVAFSRIHKKLHYCIESRIAADGKNRQFRGGQQ